MNECVLENKSESLVVRKEIQLVDPLYEPIVLYPIRKEEIPTSEDILKDILAPLGKDAYDYSIESFQALSREFVRKKLKKNFENSHGFEKIDFNKSIEHQFIKEQIRKKNRSEEKEIRMKIKGNRAITFSKFDNEIFGRREYIFEYSQPKTALKELYDVYLKLINTFEVKRLMQLQMTGFLSYKYPSSTHTRYAHSIGTWIAGLYALQNIKVDGDRLIEFLADYDIHREFMASLILHDIGHAPYSHVLEMNTYLGYDHEKIAMELINGGKSYSELEDLLVSGYIDLECGYNETYGLSNINMLDRISKNIRQPDNFILVYDIIKELDLDKDIITSFFSEDKETNSVVGALKSLVHGVIDIDRIDHIYRDLHYNSFKTMNLPLTALYYGMEFHYLDKEGKDKPWIEISEEAIPIVESVLYARELANKAIYDNPVNNFYIAALNQAVSDAIKMMPLLKYYIPYLTDQALLHILTSKDLFYNLSPNIGIINSAFFAHKNSKYVAYKIRKKEIIEENRRMPDDEYKKKIKEIICKEAEKENVTWHALLKNISKDYTPEAQTIFIGKKKEWNEVMNQFKEGITSHGSNKRSYTFSIFSHKNDADKNAVRAIGKIGDRLENELSLFIEPLKDIQPGFVGI